MIAQVQYVDGKTALIPTLFSIVCLYYILYVCRSSVYFSMEELFTLSGSNMLCLSKCECVSNTAHALFLFILHLKE